MAIIIDLNADVGEERGDDAALFGIVTSANVAAGGHAGGGGVLHETVLLATSAGVRVGAHPAYPDRDGFGRVSRARDHDAEGVAAFVRTQVLEVAAACALRSVRLGHVKAHGALYNDAVVDADLAMAFVDGVRRAGADLGEPDLPVMGIHGSALQQACGRADVPFLAEAFADRLYAPDGSLMPRHHPGAVIVDHDAAARQALSVAREGIVVASDGTPIPMPAVTLCVHGDTPGAVAMSRRVRAALEANGVLVSATGRAR